MRRIHILLPVLAAMCMIAGCVYPFEVELPNSGKILVMDGDILIGEETVVTLSYVQPISGSGNVPPPQARVCVLDEDGNTYGGILDNNSPGVFHIDTREASADRKYKVHVEVQDDGHTYESDWCEVQKPASFDRISYIKDEDHYRLAIAISISGQNSRYYRWSYDETWEYHSPYRAFFYYEPPADPMKKGSGKIKPIQGNDIYACWRTASSHEIMIFSTVEQKEDRFEDLEFHLIPRNDERISFMYYIKVNLQSMTKDAYDYWHNMRTVSDVDGSLFSPNPSEMKGNLHCLEDSDIPVLGYVCASQRVSNFLFFDNTDEVFYKNTKNPVPELEIIPEFEWYDAWKNKSMVPVSSTYANFVEEYYWAPEYCVDCRVFGGVNQRPDYWQNTRY